MPSRSYRRTQRRERAGREAAESCDRPVAGDEPGLQSTLLAEPRLRARHRPLVVRIVVVVTKKVEETVQCKDSQLGLKRVPRFASLARGHPARDYEIAQPLILGAGATTSAFEAENVGSEILVTVASVEGAHSGIGDERDRDLAPCGRRGDAREPAAETSVGDAPSAAIGDRHAKVRGTLARVRRRYGATVWVHCRRR